MPSHSMWKYLISCSSIGCPLQIPTTLHENIVIVCSRVVIEKKKLIKSKSSSDKGAFVSHRFCRVLIKLAHNRIQ